MHLTQAAQRKINAFQLKGLRRILGLQPTFGNRSNTNEFVLRRATEISGKQIKLFFKPPLGVTCQICGTYVEKVHTNLIEQMPFRSAEGALEALDSIGVNIHTDIFGTSLEVKMSLKIVQNKITEYSSLRFLVSFKPSRLVGLRML